MTFLSTQFAVLTPVYVWSLFHPPPLQASKVRKILKKMFLLLLVASIVSVSAFTSIKTSSSFLSKRIPSFHATLSNTGRDTRVTTRVRKIKELSTQKSVLNDLTAAEFALTVEVKSSEDINKIDYETIIQRLDKSLRLLQKTYSDTDANLIERVKRTKAQVIEANEKCKILQAQQPVSPLVPAVVRPTKPALEVDKLGLSVFVREDGTIDWDGAIASGKEVAKFGTELFERLNGKDESEGLPSLSELFSPAQEQEPENEETKQLAAVVTRAREVLEAARNESNAMRFKLQTARKDGQEISPSALQELRLLDARVKDEEQRLRLHTLDLDMERICLFLQQELEATMDPNDQRLFVAEVALIDKQLVALLSNLDAKTLITDELVSLIDADELTLLSNQVTYLKTRLGIDSAADREMDWGTLGKLVTEGLDKIRYYISYTPPPSSSDASYCREGVSFYRLGTRLLLNDIEYAWGLLLKAAKDGYVLKPRYLDVPRLAIAIAQILMICYDREVNAARRTGRDVLTLIPFTIILIIPLTPVGHVLVFNFIQRFFPDFFPSCYTEKRLNLLRLYSEIEKKSDDELLGPPVAAVDEEWSLQRVFDENKSYLLYAIVILLVFSII